MTNPMDVLAAELAAADRKLADDVELGEYFASLAERDNEYFDFDA